jgi:LAS superfamily LD-carboxypeptidase LdcB
MTLVWRAAARRGQLDPAFVADVEAVFQDAPFTFYALSGFRSLAEQADLYRIYQAGGPRAAPAGQSAHNYGLAIDVVLDSSDRPGLQPSWVVNAAGWQWLRQALAHHATLLHGVTFNDWPHIERRGWRVQVETAASAA